MKTNFFSEENINAFKLKGYRSKEIQQIHLQIQDIIEKNIAIAAPRRYLGRQIIKYIRFITYFKSKNAHTNIMNPYEVHYPKKLLPIIEKIVFKLQKKYNHLITNN